jgi:quercetin dioxygenase-like cupin family protein
MDRRTLLQAGMGVVAGAVALDPRHAGAGQTTPVQAKSLGAHPLGPPWDGWTGTMLEVVYAPGAASAAHQHPGPTFGYVVSGRIRWAIDGQPARVLEAGEAFFEPLGSVHTTSANASDTEPARLSVVILGKAGERLSRPAPGE